MSNDFDPSVDLTLASLAQGIRDRDPMGACDVTSARYVITTRNAFCMLTMHGLTHGEPHGSAPIVGVQAEGRLRSGHDPGKPWGLEPGPWPSVVHLDLDFATGEYRGSGWLDEAPDLSILGDVREVPATTTQAESSSGGETVESA